MRLSYLALGSNLKHPVRQLHGVLKELRQHPRIQLKRVAPFYKNRAVGRKAQPWFYNTVVEIRTNLTPYHLLATCHLLEKRHKRQRTIRWGARTLDLDILLYDDLVLKRPDLIIPHPHMHSRDFVLKPLNYLLKAQTTWPAHQPEDQAH